MMRYSVIQQYISKNRNQHLDNSNQRDTNDRFDDDGEVGCPRHSDSVKKLIMCRVSSSPRTTSNNSPRVKKVAFAN